MYKEKKGTGVESKCREICDAGFESKEKVVPYATAPWELVLFGEA